MVTCWFYIPKYIRWTYRCAFSAEHTTVEQRKTPMTQNILVRIRFEVHFQVRQESRSYWRVDFSELTVPDTVQGLWYSFACTLAAIYWNGSAFNFWIDLKVIIMSAFTDQLGKIKQRRKEWHWAKTPNHCMRDSTIRSIILAKQLNAHRTAAATFTDLKLRIRWKPQSTLETLGEPFDS